MLQAIVADARRCKLRATEADAANRCRSRRISCRRLSHIGLREKRGERGGDERRGEEAALREEKEREEWRGLVVFISG